MEGIFLVVQLKEGRYLETRKTFPYKDHIERQKSSLMSYTKQRVEKKKKSGNYYKHPPSPCWYISMSVNGGEELY